MNFNYWTRKTIGEWNRKTFEKNSVRGQRMKKISEAKEYYAAKTRKEKIRELVDYYIANAGLAERYGDEDGMLVCELIERSRFWPEINEEVQKKMFINLERKWNKTRTGEWRHVGKDKKTNERQSIIELAAKGLGTGDNWKRYYKA